MELIKSFSQWDIEKFKRIIESGTKEQRKVVLEIIQQVREQGDQALFQFTERYDQVKLTSLRVTEQEMSDAYQQFDEETLATFREAADNIRAFHTKQKSSSWMDYQESGTILGMKLQPLKRVGVYVPGGSAALLSTVLMTVIPAQVAGVEEIVMVTPPMQTGEVAPAVLAAAEMLGVQEVYKVGGAQAIAALAYGTETLRPVDKIVGPGNIYVALAKREVFGTVAIDMIAGPSEIVVLADADQNPDYIAADMLSQAEHDPLASAICITTSEKLAKQVEQALIEQLKDLPRAEIAQRSLAGYGGIYVVPTLAEGIELVNQLAPEHLELMVANPYDYLGKIKHAGAIFIGAYSAETVGDYFAGPNHVLPTSGTARFSSPLNVDDYMTKTSIIAYSKADLFQHGDKIMSMARYEGLEGHARAIEIRLAEKNKGQLMAREETGNE